MVERVYLAGPVSTDPDYVQHFERGAWHLENLGYNVHLPPNLAPEGYDHDEFMAEHKGQNPPTNVYQEWLPKDIYTLLGCEAICLLPGWERSKGANAELGVARAMDLLVGTIVFEDATTATIRWEDDDEAVSIEDPSPSAPPADFQAIAAALDQHDQNRSAHVRGDAERRKAQPVARGCLDYFPDALLAVAELSQKGGEQHHPGQPIHWEKGKSMDEADALMRHLIDRGTLDTDGIRHSAKVAWRGLALLQRELDAERER